MAVIKSLLFLLAFTFLLTQMNGINAGTPMPEGHALPYEDSVEEGEMRVAPRPPPKDLSNSNADDGAAARVKASPRDAFLLTRMVAGGGGAGNSGSPQDFFKCLMACQQCMKKFACKKM